MIRIVAVLAALLVLASCGGNSKVHNYFGPEVTRVIVNKGDREMFLMHNDEVLKTYRIHLGYAPRGHKQFEGDGRTPEGEYTIDRRNPNSAFHLSVGISYPNEQDRAYAKEMGKQAGGDIFIHGFPNGKRRLNRRDWTAGCIAVTNKQVEEIYAMVRDGTPITINP